MLKNESGRSMVEMLGVLAIIGVLSVGGIAGYTMAMKKYKANEVANAVAQCGITVQAYLATNTAAPAASICADFVTQSITFVPATNKVEATGVDSGVCTTIGTTGKVSCTGTTATYYFS